jgi:hypothetical protein
METEVFIEYLLHIHFVYHKSHMTYAELEPGPPLCKASDEPPELWHVLGTRLRINCTLRTTTSVV